MMNYLLSLVLVSLTFSAFAEKETRSGLKVMGVKYPNIPGSVEEGFAPVSTPALYENVTHLDDSGFNDLTPFLLASPNQEDAGSCLYMAHTGIAEWWLAKLHPHISRAADGPIDLSERYTMNIATSDAVKNWKTDTIYAFNNLHQGVKNTSYRYTKGWYGQDANGDIVARSGAGEGNEYGTYINWVKNTESITDGFVDLPHFERDIIFADPKSNQWNVDVMPDDIVTRVKLALLSKKAPVMVIYNHYGYWHAVMVVGFDDKRSSEGCEFTTEFSPYMNKKAKDYDAQAERTDDLELKKTLAKRAAVYAGYAQKAQQRLSKVGGCSNQGVFYIRDSIYPDPQAAKYDYDLTVKGEEGHYVKKLILREYEWLEVLANHAVQIYVE